MANIVKKLMRDVGPTNAVIGAAAIAFAALIVLKKRKAVDHTTLTPGKQYKPGSAEQIQLFEQAARAGGFPVAWAKDPDFHTLLRKESDGWVGIPNYTYGNTIKKDASKWPLIWQQLQAGIVATKSSATGLGQLTLPNTKTHYPAGPLGIGDANNEAVGMLSYVNKRYGSPQAALEFHKANGWY